MDLKNVSVSLPEEKTYIYQTNLPKQALNNLEEAIKFTLEENVPLDPSEVSFNYHIVSDDGNNIEVAVFAVSKELVLSYLRLFKEVGLTPVSFESESQSMAKAVIRKDDNNSHILINFDFLGVKISIVKGGVVRYTSTIPLNMDEIKENPEGEGMRRLAEQVNKLLVFWFTNKGQEGEKIKTAIILGEYSKIPGIPDFLGKH